MNEAPNAWLDIVGSSWAETWVAVTAWATVVGVLVAIFGVAAALYQLSLATKDRDISALFKFHEDTTRMVGGFYDAKNRMSGADVDQFSVARREYAELLNTIEFYADAYNRGLFSRRASQVILINLGGLIEQLLKTNYGRRVKDELKSSDESFENMDRFYRNYLANR